MKKPVFLLLLLLVPAVYVINTVLYSELFSTIPAADSVKLMVLFSTWAPSDEKDGVHNNTLRLWASWFSQIQPLLFTDRFDLARLGRHFGWKIMATERTNCGKIPVLKSMFEAVMKKVNTVFYGYANSDILFDDGIIHTLTYIASLPLIKKQPVLLIGRRTNVVLKNNTKVLVKKDLSKLANKIKPFTGWAEDYFFTNKLFQWSTFPDLVVGRVAIDNWLVLYARERNVTVIDLTSTVLAVHQTTHDGNFAGRKSINALCNRRLISKLKLNQHYQRGVVECAPLATVHDFLGNTVIIERKIPNYCGRK